MAGKKKTKQKNLAKNALPKTHTSKKETIALTGSGFKGLKLLEWFENDPRFTKVIYLNHRKPDITLRKSKFYRTDLTETLADVKLAELLKKEKVSTLIHTAIPITPPHNLARAHELISVGSMYLCNAAAAAGVRKLILSSTADVYGAFANNPNYLTENHPTRGGIKSRFLADKIDAEKYFLKYAKDHPKSTVTILRPTTLLGPTIKSFKTRYLSRAIVPTVLGYDPMVQFIHEDDMLNAFKEVVLTDHPGIFNLASRGVIPLSKAIALMGKIRLPLSLLGLRTLVQSLWYLDISPAPANRLDFLKYLSCVSTQKAEKELGFQPRYDCKAALLDFVGAQRLREVKLEDGVTL